MRLHIVALPHVKLGTPQTCLCAYSGKVEKFVRMMRGRHELLVYGVEGPELPGATLVPCLSEDSRISIFGQDDPNRLPDWPTDTQSRLFNLTAAAKIMERWRQGDLLLLVGGLTHLPILQALPDRAVCEPFIGYYGVIGGGVWGAYESYAHMNTVAAKMGFNDVRWFDTVIHPFCDVAEFPDTNNGDGKYLLFLGRLIQRKGPHIALEIARRAGMPLLVAGAGGRIEGGKLIGLDVTLEGGGFEYVGPVNVQERAKLMAGAKALICPTTYNEPGGNIAIEAMLAGTPVIAPDWGVFAETVQRGVSGFHFRMLRDGIKAVHRCSELIPEHIRQYAVDRYSLEATAPKFERWFDQIATLPHPGWYAE